MTHEKLILYVDCGRKTTAIYHPISFVSPLPQLGFSCSSETLASWLLPFLPVYHPRVLEAQGETLPDAGFQAGEEHLGVLLGRVVEWAVHRTTSQVSAYSQLSQLYDQGHLRNVGATLSS